MLVDIVETLDRNKGGASRDKPFKFHQRRIQRDTIAALTFAAGNTTESSQLFSSLRKI